MRPILLILALAVSLPSLAANVSVIPSRRSCGAAEDGRGIPCRSSVIASKEGDSSPSSRLGMTGVTMNVKDEDVHQIMATMQKQCAIKNLIIDPDVQVRGTFVFHSVPCSTAFKVVFQTLGLSSVDYGNSVVTVGKPVSSGTSQR